MTGRAAVWAGATLVSLALNGAAMATLWLTLQPGAPPDQPAERPEITIAGYAIPESRAEAGKAIGDAAAEADRQGTRANPRPVVAETHAAPVAPQPAMLDAARTATAPSAAARANAEPARIVTNAAQALPSRPADTRPTNALAPKASFANEAAPAATRARAQAANGQTARAARARAPRIAAARQPAIAPAAPVPSALAVTAAVSGPAARLPAAPTNRDPLDAARVEPVALADMALDASASLAASAPATAADSTPATALPGTAAQPALPPEAARIGAISVAFAPGETDLSIDPVSLAAIQSFMQPGDTALSQTDAGTARDQIGALLSSVPCARLQIEFLPDSGSVELRGHLPDDAMRVPVLATLGQFLGATIPVSDNMRVLPPPQCQALAGIASVGLPQSNDQSRDPRLVGESAQVRSYDYLEGQRMVFDVAAPEYDAFIYVDYFDARNQVIHLVPNDRVRLERLAAGATARIGAARQDGNFLEVTVGPPFGQEIAVAFAASHELFETPRPIEEPAAPYLEFLRQQVAAARRTHPDFRGEWVYFFVRTSP